MKTSLDKWGNSLGVRLPKPVADAAGLHEGDQVDVQLEEGAVVIRPAKPRYTLAELLEGMTPASRHPETGSGEPIGRERF